MIKLNRTSEYGLMALRQISRQGNASDATPRKLTSAREVADLFGLPFEITAKTLQRLKECGLIQSVQGARGGYVLKRSLEDVTLGEFLRLMEGPQILVVCSDESPESTCCEYGSRCEIKGMMKRLNTQVSDFLSGIRLVDLIGQDTGCGMVEPLPKRA